MPDGDLLGSDEDVLDQQPQHVLAFCDARSCGVAAELGEEAFQVIGEFEVGVAVSELGIEGSIWPRRFVSRARRCGHPGAQLVDGDSCSWNASIIRVIAVAALARPQSSRLRCLVAGSLVRACSRRLPISARMSVGSASR